MKLNPAALLLWNKGWWKCFFSLVFTPEMSRSHAYMQGNCKDHLKCMLRHVVTEHKLFPFISKIMEKLQNKPESRRYDVIFHGEVSKETHTVCLVCSVF